MKKLIIPSFLFFCFILPAQISAQCVSGNCQNGKGTYVYPSGAKYIGAFQNGEIHGIGVCYYTDGSKYSGQWVHRFPEGRGTKTYPDGSKRSGQWHKGRPVDAQGNVEEEIWTSKGEEEEVTNIQTGCISGDCKNGKGVFAYADGSRYEGTFTGGRLEGKGTFYYPNGDKFIGAFKNNYSHGSGVFYYADGSKTTGEWREGEYFGASPERMGEEGCVSGNCTNGEGIYVFRDGAARYQGAFQGGRASGYGTCDYANGERYEGDWANGSFNGVGTLYMKDGKKVKGRWKDGTYLGAVQAVRETPQKLANTIDDLLVGKKEIPEKEAVKKEIPKIKVWALVIGIASYSHMPVLRYTDDDAYRMYAFLKSPEGGALPDEQIKILIDEDATKERITSTMTDVFGKAGPNDLVMLYFSGHGLKGSFLPIDFDGYNNKLFHEEINEILEQSPAKYKLCIADACHSGSLFAMKSGTIENTLSNFYTSLAQAQPGTALIMSSKSDETSLESSGLRQGVFSHFLIRGLKGEADKDNNTIVSVQELFDFINENVRSYTGMRQSPMIEGDYDPQMTVSVKR